MRQKYDKEFINKSNALATAYLKKFKYNRGKLLYETSPTSIYKQSRNGLFIDGNSCMGDDSLYGFNS